MASLFIFRCPQNAEIYEARGYFRRAPGRHRDEKKHQAKWMDSFINLARELIENNNAGLSYKWRWPRPSLMLEHFRAGSEIDLA
jgi:hypothetical protein